MCRKRDRYDEVSQKVTMLGSNDCSLQPIALLTGGTVTEQQGVKE